MRDWLKKNAALTGIFALAVIAATIGWYLRRPAAPVVIAAPLYFYDLGTNSLFVAPASLPPIEPPSKHRDNLGNPGGALAHVFSCSDCAKTDTHFIGYLETYTKRGREIMESSREDPPAAIAAAMEGAGEWRMLSSGKTPIEWVPDKDFARESFLHEVANKCGKGKPIECRPPTGAAPAAK